MINQFRKKQSRERAKGLKDNATYYEKFFRTLLKRWKIPHQFQKVIFVDDYRYYIVDFYIPKFRTVIEIDGRGHDKNKGYDNNRTHRLKRSGVRKVIRFRNEEVTGKKPKRLRELLIINLLG